MPLDHSEPCREGAQGVEAAVNLGQLLLAQFSEETRAGAVPRAGHQQRGSPGQPGTWGALELQEWGTELWHCQQQRGAGCHSASPVAPGGSRHKDFQSSFLSSFFPVHGAQ